MDMLVGTYLLVGAYFLWRSYGEYTRRRSPGTGERAKFALFTVLAWPVALYWNWKKQFERGRK